jgi:hypothetical protein
MKAKESHGMESHELLSHCFKKLGVKHCAAELGLSAPLLYKWCESNKGTEDSGAVNPLDRVAQIVRLTEDRSPVEWLCTQAGGVFVADSLADKSTLPAMMQQTHKILKEFSDLIHVISVGMADDGRIDRDESNRIREEWQQMKTIVEGFVRACEKGFYETQH